MEAFGIKLEVVDQSFHGALHIGAARWGHFGVFGQNGALGHHFDTLLDDASTFAHLIHAAQIAVIAIAILANRHFELQFRIDFIGLAAAQIPRDARPTDHHARKAPVQNRLLIDDPDIDVALLEDAVIGQQGLDIVAQF